ncbi:hippocampus abundant transcript 1 protein-like [Melanaphis sacchari]|uniref:Solute carrier family 46 member 3 n=1 Tax=Melanaphis sacchari TaxID=742174 RepID=A0A2H8TLE6_9HEMI|nr:hippocampus abundant transcript 1 protein-like [Melanaphis sacchari]XP_025194111.1 hippocampus abundant transcript 1 protein-like [Melanaphis sacchari]
MAKYTLTQKSFKAFRCAVTLEPMLFVYFTATVLSYNVSTNMLFHKGCDPNATAAPDLRASTDCLLENSAQHGVSSINVWKHMIQELISVVFIIFAGPWSDLHGRRRRPLMFMPVIGQIICDAFNMLSAVFWDGVSPFVTGITQSLIVSLTGMQYCFFIGMYAYLADITDMSNRTMRIGFASAVLPLAATLGGLAGGYLNVKLGFVAVFALNVALNVIALCLGLLFIYDTSEPYETTGSLYKTTFDPKIVVESVKTVFVRRENHNRLILLLMIVASPLTGAPFVGEIGLMYMYLRKQFDFREIDYSLFNTYSMGIMLFGSIVSLKILSQKLKMNDAMIGLIVTTFDIATAVGFLSVTKFQYLLFVPPLELFRGAALALSGAIASKCVKPHELGSMNSVRTAIENLSKSAILPLYSIVYNKTLEFMPSAFFIISICLTAPLIVCFGITYYLTRNQEKSVNSDLEK